jgi:hypothetical protein
MVTNRLKTVSFWSYLCLLTYELLLRNPWVILGNKIASNPPLDTHTVIASGILHSGAFSVLGFLGSWAYRDRPEHQRVRYALWLIAYCWVTEVLQTFVPNRWPSGEDILFNVFGLFAGVLVFYLPGRYFQAVPEEAASI